QLSSRTLTRSICLPGLDPAGRRLHTHNPVRHWWGRVQDAGIEQSAARCELLLDSTASSRRPGSNETRSGFQHKMSLYGETSFRAIPFNLLCPQGNSLAASCTTFVTFTSSQKGCCDYATYSSYSVFKPQQPHGLVT